MISKKTAIKTIALLLALLILTLSLYSCIKYSETEPLGSDNIDTFIKKYNKDFQTSFYTWQGIEYSSELTTSENNIIKVSFKQNFEDGISHLIVENIANNVTVMFIDCYIKGEYIYYNSFNTNETGMEKVRLNKLFSNETIAYLDTSVSKDVLASIFKADGDTLSNLGADILAVKDEDKNKIFNVKYSEDYLKSKNEGSNGFLASFFKDPSQTDFTNIKFGECSAKYVFNKNDIIQYAQVYTNLTIYNIPYVSNFKISNYSEEITFDPAQYTPILEPRG